MLPGKAKGPLPPQQAFFLFGGCLRKERFFRHTAQERRERDTQPPGCNPHEVTAQALGRGRTLAIR